MSVARAKREVSLEEYAGWMVFFSLESENRKRSNGSG
jgi:hypothetical protein